MKQFSVAALSDEEKEKLYVAIGYNEKNANPVYPREVKY